MARKMKYYGVIDPDGDAVPCSISYHKNYAINRFLKMNPGSWHKAKKRGFYVGELIVEPKNLKPQSTTTN